MFELTGFLTFVGFLGGLLLKEIISDLYNYTTRIFFSGISKVIEFVVELRKPDPDEMSVEELVKHMEPNSDDEISISETQSVKIQPQQNAVENTKAKIPRAPKRFD